MSDPTYGFTHSLCAEQGLLYRPIFERSHIAELDNESFRTLKEMVSAEDNIRNGMVDEIDLF